MIDSLSTFLIAVKDLLEALQKQKIIRDQKLDEALEAIVSAIFETRKYIERTNTNEKDRVKELDLSKLWKVAAIKVRKIDPALATRLQFKSLYWEDAMCLSRKEILEKGIALRQVEDEFKKLFSHK
jgi:hypothetical protein